MDTITITQAADIIEECRAESANSWKAAIDNAFGELKKRLTKNARECDKCYASALEYLDGCYEGWLTFAMFEIENAVSIEDAIQGPHARRALEALWALKDDDDEDEDEDEV